MSESRRSLPLIASLVVVLAVASGCGDGPTRVTNSQPTPDPTPFVTTVGSAGRDEVHDVAVDPSGNVFVTGGVNEKVEIGGQTFDPALGATFLAKFDPTGEFLWIKHIAGAFPDGPLRLGTDNSGDVVIEGQFSPTLAIDGVTVTASGGGEHVFVARLSGSGRVKWVSYDEGEYLSVGFGMGTGPSGATAVTGFIQAGATFGSNVLTVPGFDFFVVSCDSKGTARWAKQTGSNTVASGAEAVVDAQGNVVVAGNFNKSFTLDGVEITADAGDSFIASYNASGELQWLESLGDNTAEAIEDIATDQDGDIYVAGRTGVSMLWKLDSNGGVIWESPAVPAGHIAVDLDKKIVLSGSFTGTLNVGGMDAISNGSLDFFVARYDAAGQGVSIVSGGASGGDRAQGLALGGDGAAIIVVDFWESFDFDGTTITSQGDQDVMVTRLE